MAVSDPPCTRLASRSLAPACPVNTYQPYLASDTCLACPANAITLSEASTDLSQCLCAAGYTGPNGGTCTACPANTYKAATGSASCTACPANSATAGSATTSAAGCVCAAGYVGPNGGPCAACFAGANPPCDGNANCLGGASCGGCKSGYSGNGTVCTAIQAQVATVRASSSQGGSAGTSSSACAGVPYLSSTCTACANNGLGTALSGTSANQCGPNGSPCCNAPLFYIQMNTTGSLMYPFFKFNVGNGGVCFSNFQLGINYNQQPQSCTGNVTTTLEFIEANWDPLTISWDAATNYPTIKSITVELASREGTLRTIDVSSSAQLNAINENIAFNGGLLSFKLRRSCSSGLSGAVANSFYGVSFPGTANAALNPSIMNGSAFQTCDIHASCKGAQGCQCDQGYVGNGVTCATCASACPPNFECPGGNTCGNCFPGYTNVGGSCVPHVYKVATVRRSFATNRCSGMPLYASSSAALAGLGGCDACQTGPGSGATVCGWSQGYPTYCCYGAKYIWAASNDDVTAYPYFALPILGGAGNAKLCTTALSFATVDILTSATSCSGNTHFQIGFVRDDQWDSSLTWAAVADNPLLQPTATINFTAPSLAAYVPSPEELDLFTANIVANNGRLSIYIKRWCANATIEYTNPAHDDYSLANVNFQLATFAYETCGSNAQCSRAQCACATNYYGDGTHCTRSYCTATVVSRSEGTYIFNSTDAGATATSACPLGYTGQATRLCRWVPNAEHGVWDEAVVACAPIQCPAHSAYNATFPARILGETSGSCDFGYVGFISRQCLLNTTTNTGYWTQPIGSCSPVACAASTYNFAEWPEVMPLGAARLVDGQCIAGYAPTNPAAPPQRLCKADGTYEMSVVNACVRNRCAGETAFNAEWPQTLSDLFAEGACGDGYEGTPTRYCHLNGTWAATVQQPCTRRVCAAEAAGGMVWNATLAGDVATGACQPGYASAGSLGAPTRLCQMDGTWAAAVSEPCVRITCDAVPEDGHAAWNQTYSGDIAVGTCLPGWSGAPYRTCLTSGVFGTIQNPCVQNKCAGGTWANATFVTAIAGTVGNVGTCLPGFNGTIARDCGLDGNWTNAVGECVQLYCSAVDDTTDPDFLATFPAAAAGTVAIGTCVSGKNGRPQRRCLADGEWDDVVLLNPCSEDTCPALADDHHANWTTGVPGQTQVGECGPGYYGPSERLCDPELGWLEPTTECTRYACPAETVDRASFGAALAGETGVAGTCEAGWQGAPLRTCNLLGNWEDDPSSVPCTQIFCEQIDEDDVTYNRTAAGSTTTGVCRAGLGGLSQRECSLNGQWLLPVGSCIQQYCSPADDGLSTFPTAPAGTAGVKGTCKPGFRRAAAGVDPTRDCGLDTNWSEVANQCVPIVCEPSTAGFASFGETAAGVTATGTCVAGYGTSGAAPTRKCEMSGVWAAVNGACVQLTCPSSDTSFHATWPANIPAGTSNVFGTCEPGYQGAPRRDCLLNGQWGTTNLGDDCVQIFCPNRTEENAFWPTTATGATAVTVRLNGCLPTYTFTSGNNPQRACNVDGSWGPIINACQRTY